MRERFACVSLVALLFSAFVATPAVSSTSDPFYSLQWGLQKIQAEHAWPTTDGTGALVAVVDTGVDLTHPDLQANVWSDGHDLVEPDGTCKKEPGRNGARTCVQDGAQDKNGHGTHVAGIVAAVTNNGTGVAGVAPGAKILPIRVLDADGSGTTEQVAAGIRAAADGGADVINLSLGFLSGVGTAAKLVGWLEPVYSAIDYAWASGAVVVVAAGNDSVPLCAEPAAAGNAVCVGATDSRDLISWFSNSDLVLRNTYLVAPGGEGLTCRGDIYSTVLRGIRVYCGGVDGYDAYAGTSMATPHVAGVAALLAAKGLTNQQIVACLTSTSDDLGLPGRDGVYGYGRVNAARAATSC